MPTALRVLVGVLVTVPAMLVLAMTLCGLVMGMPLRRALPMAVRDNWPLVRSLTLAFLFGYAGIAGFITLWSWVVGA